MDPMAHKYDNVSPYAYSLNNPVFFIDPDGMDVVNGAQVKLEQAEEKLAQAEAKVAAGEKQYGTKKSDFKSKGDYKRYKGYKKEMRQAQREVNGLKSDVEATENLISDLKSDRSNTFEKLDNLTNESGETVDVYVHVTSDIPGPNDGVTVHGFNMTSNDKAIPETGFKVNSIEVMISNNPSGNRTTLTVMDHERGHVIYQAENTTSYYQYLKNANKLNKQNYNGHAKDDPSGQSADYLEDKGNTKKFYKD